MSDALPYVQAAGAALPYIGKHVAYPFTVDENISAMETALEELQAIQKDVNDNIKDERQQVVDWDRKVNDITEKVNDITGRFVQPYNHVGTNYSISRKAAKILPELNYLINYGREIQKGPGVLPRQQPPGVHFKFEKTPEGGKKFNFMIHFGGK